jgi:hypothetical protein
MADVTMQSVGHSTVSTSTLPPPPPQQIISICMDLIAYNFFRFSK